MRLFASATRASLPSHLEGAQPAATPAERYHPVAVILHWSTAIMVGGATIVALVSEAASGIGFKLALTNAHFVLGSLVLMLSLARVAWRLAAPSPVSDNSIAARRAHLMLYVLMFAVPAFGLGAAFLYGRNIAFGLFEIAAPLATDKEKAKIIGDIHGLLAWSFMTLLSGHVLMFLWRHYVRNDRLLERMSFDA
jgi:cytochrome b561